MKRQEKIKKFYNQYPFPSSVNYRAEIGLIKIIETVFPNLFKKRIKILDAGCGTGEISCRLAQKGGDVLGIDNSGQSLKKARKLARKLNLTNITFRKKDILYLNFASNYFDLVICNGVLHHIENYQLAFKNLARVTKPKGIIIIAVYEKFGSLKRKLIRKLVCVSAGKDDQQKIKFLRGWYREKLSKMSDSEVMDAYFNPYEKTFTLPQIFGLFKREKIDYLESIPPVEIEYYPLIAKLALKRVFSKRRFSKLDLWARTRKLKKLVTPSPSRIRFLLVGLFWMLTSRSGILTLTGSKKASS